MDIVFFKQILITTISTLGIGATVIFGLASWLGSLWARRILQLERGVIEEKLKSIEHELSFSKTSYGNHLNQILEYYDIYYSHYRTCQLTAEADIIRFPDGDDLNTQESYFEELEKFQIKWNSIEGKVRFILPKDLLECHEKSINCFNEFNAAAKKYTSQSDLQGRAPLEEAFKKLDDVKNNYEKLIRAYLRTENMLAK
ncbi:hypothetical protein [Thalassolituus sp.]|jgi:hypothetical protein|uniref:hypothetical protein n=1 Tax=Thalassolituus sp. TaxID=2030822 RepID=UPI002A803B2F|nr:hypothetical protein [Thalassolituus sp.]